MIKRGRPLQEKRLRWEQALWAERAGSARDIAQRRRWAGVSSEDSCEQTLGVSRARVKGGVEVLLGMTGITSACV